MTYRNLILIFGDQLTHTLASFDGFDKKQDLILMMEVEDEATYVPHHKQKLVFIFSAMRHFAQELMDKNYQIEYIQLDSAKSKGSFNKTLQYFLQTHDIDKIVLTEPSEYRVLHDIRSNWKFDIDIDLREDNRFFCSKQAFKEYYDGVDTIRMEYFYRHMRKKTGILMENDQPAGGLWNFDKDNRQKYDFKTQIPEAVQFNIDDITASVIELVNSKFSHHMGELRHFNWAVTRRSALMQLQWFLKTCLAHFGRFQDAMVHGEYQLFHSFLSPYLNIGLLTAPEVIEKAVYAYHSDNQIPINAIEGFVRQILGWREYVRGIYWLKMPEYANQNYLDAKHPLPDFYWSGETKMACMQHAIQQTIDIAHSHHIQRLMITGNFALLTGIDIAQVCQWYLAVYIDAFEWVELPNTLGMVAYADNGLMASKPYAASGNYINKMSDFCQTCIYDVKKKVGTNACPFNALYWHFLKRNENKLGNNHRLTYPYATLKRMDENKVKSIMEHADYIIDKM